MLTRTIYAVCLLLGTFTHVRTLVEHGLLWDYGGAPWISCVFWTSLTFVDPVAAAVLFWRPIAGLQLALAIMVADVLHNGGYLLASGSALITNFAFLAQSGFLAFVILTIALPWREARRLQAGGRDQPVTPAGPRPRG